MCLRSGNFLGGTYVREDEGKGKLDNEQRCAQSWALAVYFYFFNDKNDIFCIFFKFI